MANSATPFLMFQGQAEEAINSYLSLFSGSKVESLMKFPAEDPLSGGKVMMARLTLCGQTFLVNDSMIGHAFTFTPSFSIFIACDSAAELDDLFGRLSQGGEVLMGVDNYGFSQRFAWVQDRFGVSFQLNLAS